MKISIIGLSGSGKSTLARNISEALGIPHLDIDRLWFESNGHKIPLSDSAGREGVDAYIKKKVEEFVVQDSWVTDGWYRKVQPIITAYADSILFLNIPLFTRIRSHLWRTFFEERHKELSTWDDLKFVYKMTKRTYRHGPLIRQFVQENASKIKTFHTYREINEYIDNLRLAAKK